MNRPVEWMCGFLAVLGLAYGCITECQLAELRKQQMKVELQAGDEVTHKLQNFDGVILRLREDKADVRFINRYDELVKATYYLVELERN